MTKYEELKIELRKWKINSILEQSNIKFDKENLDPKLFNLLTKLSERGVITGSCVLRLFGLIPRNPTDIDFVVNEDTFNILSENHNIIGHIDTYGKEISSKGYVMFKDYKIDLFVSNDVKFSTIEGINVENIEDITKFKVKLSRLKDYQDFDDMYSAFRGIVHPKYKEVNFDLGEELNISNLWTSFKQFLKILFKIK